MPHYCQGLNHLSRDAARRIYEQRLAEAYQQRLARNPGLLPRGTRFTWLDIETRSDWMDDLSTGEWNNLMGGPDMDGDA